MFDRAGFGFRANIVEKYVMQSVVVHVAVRHKNTVLHVSDSETSNDYGYFPACGLADTTVNFATLL